MKIVHVANFYGPNSGGIKTTLHNLGLGYQKHGHEFYYIVPGTQLRREETQYGIKISLPSVILPGSGAYRIIRSNRLLRKTIAELAPDRLEVSDRFTLRGLGPWARAQKIPTVVFSHETLRGLAARFLPAFLPQHALVNWHNRGLASRFDQVIATTQFAAKEFEEIGTTNITRVPLGVDLVNFSPELRSIELRNELRKGNKLLIVHCGRLSPEKEPQRSLEALIELRKRGVDARLVVIGTGPMWKKLREMAQGHPIDLLGYIANPKKVAAILACADVALAPGPLETFCLSALEALASGTPVVASKSSAVGEFLNIDAPIPAGAVASDNAESFADAIMNLTAIDQARIEARNAALALPWETSVRKMLELHNIPTVGENAPMVATKRKLSAA